MSEDVFLDRFVGRLASLDDRIKFNGCFDAKALHRHTAARSGRRAVAVALLMSMAHTTAADERATSASFEAHLPTFEIAPELRPDGSVYCGERVVRNIEQSNSPLLELGNAIGGHANGERYEANARARFDEFVESYRVKLRRANFHAGLDGLVTILNNLYVEAEQARCALSWWRRRMDELEPVRQKALAEERTARAEFDEVDTRCDAMKPARSGWMKADDEAEAWLDCRRSIRSERASKLKQLRRAQSRASLVRL